MGLGTIVKVAPPSVLIWTFQPSQQLSSCHQAQKVSTGSLPLGRPKGGLWA